MATGRKTGVVRKARKVASAGIKALLGEVLSGGKLKRRWTRWFGHRDEHIAFEACRLAVSYLTANLYSQ